MNISLSLGHNLSLSPQQRATSTSMLPSVVLALNGLNGAIGRGRHSSDSRRFSSFRSKDQISSMAKNCLNYLSTLRNAIHNSNVFLKYIFVWVRVMGTYSRVFPRAWLRPFPQVSSSDAAKTPLWRAASEFCQPYPHGALVFPRFIHSESSTTSNGWVGENCKEPEAITPIEHLSSSAWESPLCGELCPASCISFQHRVLLVA